MKLIGVNIKKTGNNKNERSKREIKDELLNRKNVNINREHPILKFLEPKRDEFIKKFEPLDFDMGIVRDIVKKGIPANSFNLMIERIAKKENE